MSSLAPRTRGVAPHFPRGVMKPFPPPPRVLAASTDAGPSLSSRFRRTFQPARITPGPSDGPSGRRSEWVSVECRPQARPSAREDPQLPPPFRAWTGLHPRPRARPLQDVTDHVPPAADRSIPLPNVLPRLLMIPASPKLDRSPPSSPPPLQEARRKGLRAEGREAWSPRMRAGGTRACLGRRRCAGSHARWVPRRRGGTEGPPFRRSRETKREAPGAGQRQRYREGQQHGQDKLQPAPDASHRNDASADGGRRSRATAGER